MKMRMTAEIIKENLGNLIVIGSQPKYKYDRENRRKTQEIEGTSLEIASEKLGKTINITCDDTSLDLPAFAAIELINLEYNPYAKAVSANFAELVERFTCTSVTVVKGKVGLNNGV